MGATTDAIALPLEGEPRSVTFDIYGIPKPKGSARAFVAMKAGKKPRAIVTTDNKSLKSWEAAVRDAARDVVGQAYFTEAVSLEIDFWFPRPKSVSAAKRPHMTTKPDLSKLLRGAEDALNGVIFKDDAQVVRAITAKRYVDGPAGARITVTEMFPKPTAAAPRASKKTKATPTTPPANASAPTSARWSF